MVKRDPLSDIEIPPKNASNSIKLDHMEDHVSWAKSNSRGLVTTPIKDEIVKETAHRLAELGPEKAILERRKFMKHIRKRAKALRGAADARLARLPKHIQRVLSACGRNKVNIPLLEELGREFYPEGIDSLVNDLEEGFAFIGEIPVEGRADLDKFKEATLSQTELEERSEEISEKVLSSGPTRDMTFEDHQTILQQTKDEISMGRMGEFRKPSTKGKYPLTKRFAVRQLSSKGVEKLRCIDDYLRSEINALASVDGRISMGKINDLLRSIEILAEAVKNSGEDIDLLKSDFKAAYRSCPIKTEHLPLTRIAAWDPEGQRYLETQHFAMPFGALSAVYAWDRLGACLTAILSRALAVPICRYVDDLFMAAYHSGASELRSQILEVIELLGFTLEEEKTPEPSGEQTILGINVKVVKRRIRGVYRYSGQISVDPLKRQNWKKMISEVLKRGRISPRIASKFAGRFNFISHAVLGPLGGSRLRQLYRFAFMELEGRISLELKDDLKWWSEYLTDGEPVVVHIYPRDSFVPILYTDAEGSGGLGAVAIPNLHQRLWFSSHIEHHILPDLEERKTQIIAYEASAALIGLSRFKNDFANRDVVVFIDNMSAKGAIRKGRCSKDDIQSIINHILELAKRNKMRIHPFGVPSSLNISDFPSRCIAISGIKVKSA